MVGPVKFLPLPPRPPLSTPVGERLLDYGRTLRRVSHSQSIQVNYPLKKFSFPDIPWLVPLNFYPCPHVHLYQRQWARDCLTTEEHFDVLATPKGYRWYGKSEKITKRAIEGRPGKKRLIPKKPPFPGFKQFMAEIWNVLTPDMILCLKNILQEELGMSSQDAVEFLVKQRSKSLREAKAEVLGPCPNIKGADICWARDMAAILAEKMTLMSEMMTVSPQSRRTRRLKAYLTEALHRLVGLEDEGSWTPVRALLYRLAGVIAVWLSTLPLEKDVTRICDEFATAYSTISLI